MLPVTSVAEAPTTPAFVLSASARRAKTAKVASPPCPAEMLATAEVALSIRALSSSAGRGACGRCRRGSHSPRANAPALALALAAAVARQAAAGTDASWGP